MKSFIRTGLVLTTLGAFAIASGCGADSGGGGGFAATGGSAGAGTGGTISTGGTIGVGGSAGAGGGNLDGGCANKTVQGKLIPPNLLFVIDRSGSMNCNLPSDGQSTANCEAFPTPLDPGKPTKWQLTKDALKVAFDDLTAGGNTFAGLDMFPNDGSECLVDSTPNISIATLDSAQNTAIDTFLDAVKPQGKTPLAGATILSYQHLYEQLKANALTGNLFVVLLTDGFETCKPEELPKLLQQDVPNASNGLGIRTFVIGVPGSEDGRALLSQMAYLGGTAKSATCVHDPAPNDVGDCHFDMTTSQNFSADLKAALTAISGTVLSCELDMPKAEGGGVPDWDKVQVLINNAPVDPAQGGNCDTANGWQYNADKTKIFLCGSACTQAKQPNASVQIYVPCGIT